MWVVCFPLCVVSCLLWALLSQLILALIFKQTIPLIAFVRIVLTFSRAFPLMHHCLF